MSRGPARARPTPPPASGYDPGMLRTDVDAILVEVLRDRRLLAHPFYRRWEAGTLERAELAAYAAQYRHFEAALPDRGGKPVYLITTDSLF